MIRHYLPEFLNKRLFGDRSKFSDRFDEQDQDWLKWQNFSFAQKPTLVNGVKMYYFYKQLPKTKVTVQPILREVGPIWTTELTSDGQL